jgi:hypothetical protein
MHNFVAYMLTSSPCGRDEFRNLEQRIKAASEKAKIAKKKEVVNVKHAKVCMHGCIWNAFD